MQGQRRLTVSAIRLIIVVGDAGRPDLVTRWVPLRVDSTTESVAAKPSLPGNRPALTPGARGRIDHVSEQLSAVKARIFKISICYFYYRRQKTFIKSDYIYR